MWGTRTSARRSAFFSARRGTPTAWIIRSLAPRRRRWLPSTTRRCRPSVAPRKSDELTRNSHLARAMERLGHGSPRRTERRSIMTTVLSPVIASRLEKAAVDNGFDQELSRDGIGSHSRARNARFASGSARLATRSHLRHSRSRTSCVRSASTGLPWLRRCPSVRSAAARLPTFPRYTDCSAARSSSARRFLTSFSTASKNRQLLCPPRPRLSG